MKNAVLVLLFCFSSCVCLAQSNYIFKGTQRFKATDAWEFNIENYPHGALQVQIARSGSTGFILLEVENPFGEYIVGKITIYLQNGEIISCIDRGVRDRTNGKSRTLYSFTSNEMEMLSASDLSQIRFAIGGVGRYGNSLRESYVAENKSYKLIHQVSQFQFEPGSHSTAEEVTLLME
jgi:hypothetical protein